MKDKAVSGVKNLISNVINFFKTLPGKIWDAIVSAVTRIGTWASNMKNKAVSGVTSLVNSVVSFFKQLPGKIKSAISSAITAIGTWCTNMRTKASNGIKNVVSSVVNGFKSLPSKLLNVGKNIVEGLWNGIKNAKDWLIGKIKSFAKGITSGIKAALGIKSPSRVMRDEVGRYIAEGIGAGITANANNPLNALKKLGDDMANQDINLNGATINRKLATTFAVDGGAVSMDEAILNKLDTLADKISRLKMVLNNGVLVGELLDDIDAGLADKQLLSIRGV
jgi:phage-related protein